MKALILAAGYGTKLSPLTKDRSTSLFTVREKTIIEYIINKLESLEEVDEMLIVTNQKFFKQFQNWFDHCPSTKPIKLLNDGSLNNKSKLGAIGDIDLVIKKEQIVDDLLVVGGDNLFSFGLHNFVDFAYKKGPHNSIGIYNLNGKLDPSPVRHRCADGSANGVSNGASPVRNQRFLNGASKFGMVQLNESGEIIDFQEKPLSFRGSLIAMCLYFFPKEKLASVSDYLSPVRHCCADACANGVSNGVSHNSHCDAPGHYISWLAKSDKVYGYTFNEGIWFDIGDIEAYTEAVFTF